MSLHDRFEYEDDVKALRAIVAKSEPRGKFAADNAFRKLEAAYRILDIDPSIAVFTALTAEEESVSAIFDALKRHGYAGAEKLDRQNHKHKWALQPFLSAVSQQFIDASQTFTIKTGITTDDRVILNIFVKGRELPFQPYPPLNVPVTIDEKPLDFEKHLQKIAKDYGVDRIQTHVRDLANFRNLLLYAHKDGLYGPNDPPKMYLDMALLMIIRNVSFYLMIDQTPSIQSFAQHCLDCFLPIIIKAKAEDDHARQGGGAGEARDLNVAKPARSI